MQCFNPVSMNGTSMNEIANLAYEEEAVIRCKNISLHSGTTQALDRVSIAIPRGAVVGLVGRNGAGKSTLLRCMVGLAAPDSGTANLLGCPALDMSDDVRARLGYVAQTPDLFEWMSVYEHLETIGRAYPTWNEIHCLILAARLDLPLGRQVGKLSGGDQQKLAVVLALAHDPEVLILDEPVSNLDPMSRREFMRSLFLDREDGNNAARVQPTIVISSHLLSDLERVVSHVAFLHEGYLQHFDTWDAILEHIRLIPQDAEVSRSAIVRRNRDHCVIDTRQAPEWRETGQVATFDQLFAELNV